MAVVHRGTHRATGTPVAIKVVTGAASDAMRRALEQEVRRVALLDHPAIIRVHDQGQLPRDAARHGLTPGDPWLAMERIDGGSLEGVVLGGWQEARGVLDQLLGALAHAHARGLVHQDLKPGNVLRASTGRVVLTDFGIARARSEQRSGSVTGTPWVMAPEQVQGEQAAVGPWTDLYALGCTAWWLICGGPPFRGTDPVQVMADQVSAPLPALHPRFAVPEAFEHWLRRLLAKDPMLRFQRAADARAALGALDEPTEVAVASIRPLESVGASTASAETWSADLPVIEARAGVFGVGEELAPVAAPVRPRVPSVGPRGFVDTGLGLAGLRRPPLLGRDDHWAALCDALDRVRERDVAAGIALHGQPGVGRSWLARSFAEAAEELGAAVAVVVEPSDSLVAAVLRTIGCGDAVDASALDRLERWWRLRDPEVESSQVEDLGAWVPDGVRRAACWRLLETLARDRPVILLLDEVGLQPEALALARRGIGRPGAVLILSTGPTPVEGFTPMPLEPLERPEVRVLVDTLVQLSPRALEDVVDLVAGRPSAAVALVEALVSSGQLVATAGGAALAGPVALPDSLVSLSLGALDAAGVTASDRRALELAAALGNRVRREHWFGLTGRAEAEDRRLADALVRSGIWSEAESGWWFTDGMVRDALRDTSEDWGARCLAVAELLRSSTDSTEIVIRAAALREAGHLEEALEPLAEGLAQLTYDDDYYLAEEAAVGFLDLIDTLGLSPAEPRLARGLRFVVSAFHDMGWNEQLGELGRTWLELPEVAEGRCELSVHAWRAVCEQERGRGNVAAAVEAAERSYAAYLEHGGVQVGHPEFVLARCLGEDRASFDRALELYQVTIAHLEPSWQAAAWYYSHILLDLMPGRQAEAKAAIERAWDCVDDSVGPTTGVLVAAARGQFYANQGDLERGIAGWRAAIPVMDRYGYLSAPFARLNLAALLARQGEVSEAERVARMAMRDFTRTGRTPAQGSTATVLFHTAVLRDDFAGAREWLSFIRDILERVTMTEPALADQLEFAVSDLDGRDPALGIDALEVAMGIWEGLEMTEHQARVQAAIDGLRAGLGGRAGTD